MSAKIGSLNVDLTLETARFKKGIKESQSSFGKFQGKMASFAKKIAVGVAGISAAVGGVNKVLGDLAREAKDMRIAAQVAGEGFEEFQRQAYAATRVGIEFDKLGDIFKDVRDRVGDFVQTGGGPMADFFEKIAPKVGVTAKMFEGLGGKDALQLYYDSLEKANLSQEDMVFYLEAMASDATALIPLLQDGGKAMKEFGDNAAIITEEDAAQLRRYSEATARLENTWKRLTLTLVDAGLIESFEQLVSNLDNIVRGFTDVEVAAAKTEEQMRRNQSWHEFGKQLSITNDMLNQWARDYRAMNTSNAESAKAFWSELASGFSNFNQRMIDGANRIKAGFMDLVNVAVGASRSLFTGVKTWFMDRLAPVFDYVTSKIEKVEQGFAWLYDRVVGNSWVPDMVDAVGMHMRRLDKQMVDPALKATRTTDEAFRAMAVEVGALLDRLFPRIARMQQMYAELKLIDSAVDAGQIDPELAQEARRRVRADARGTGRALPSFAGSEPVTIDRARTMSRTVDMVNESFDKLRRKSEATAVRVVESFKEMAQGTISALRTLADSIKGGDFFGILEGLVGIFTQLGSNGLFGKNIANAINGASLPAYANGTRFHPGGFALVGERGPEIAYMPRGSQVFTNQESKAMMQGGSTVRVVPSPYFDVVVDERIGKAAPAIAQSGASLAGQRAQVASRRRIGS